MSNKNICNRHNPSLSDRMLYSAYKLFFGTLTSESRLRIINLLRFGPKNVSEIQHELNLGQTIISHDLQRLRKCGFVSVEKDGKYRHYSLDEKTIKPLMEIIDIHMDGHCKMIIAGKEGN